MRWAIRNILVSYVGWTGIDLIGLDWPPGNARTMGGWDAVLQSVFRGFLENALREW